VLQIYSDDPYKRVALEDVAEDLEAKLGIPVRLDVRALGDKDIQTHVPVTFAASKISARSAIGLMLRRLDLTFVIRYDTLLVTSSEEADNLLETRVYDVSDLIGEGEKPRGGALTDKDQRPHDGQGMFSVSEVSAAQGNAKSDSQPPTASRSDRDKKKRINERYEIPLIAAIANSVQPRSWGGDGGPGTITLFESPGIHAIVAWQTQSAHEEIGTLLSQMRAIRDRKAGRSPDDSQSPPTVQPAKNYRRLRARL
jgi:hypothetical protein